MELSEEQKDVVKGWVKDGDGLSEIQKRLSSEFNVTMTYMDVRFLIIDLEVNIKEEETAKPKTTEEAPVDATAVDTPPAGGLQVEVDVLMRPGALLSGKVVFSDGVTAVWMLDQTGRLAIEPSQPEYKPSEDDNAAFVKVLQEEIAKKGY